jgi:hypothetical protein
MPKICQHKNNNDTYCNNKALYGTKSYTPLFCKNHKADTMKYVLSTPLCKCGTYASYGYSENRTRVSCAKCKLDGMIDLSSRLCQCGTIALYGYPNKKPTHCSKCKKDNMIDLKSKKCKCGKIPSFGSSIDSKPTHCKNCKSYNMINVKKKKNMSMW